MWNVEQTFNQEINSNIHPKGMTNFKPLIMKISLIAISFQFYFELIIIHKILRKVVMDIFH